MPGGTLRGPMTSLPEMGYLPTGGAPFAESVDAAVADRTFAAYTQASVPGHERLRAELLRLVEEALVAGGADLTQWRQAVASHLEDRGHRASFYDGMSAPRAGRDLAYETRLAEAESRLTGAGAVHLELGSWTAWPDERVQALIDADGLSEVIRLDFDPAYEPDLVADARALPFRDSSLDRISADSVIEHVPHPHLVLAECFRVLRPGGLLKLITPFAFTLHGYPDDHLRYTPSWYELVLTELGFETVVADVEASRGLYYTLHNSAKAAIVDPGVEGAAGFRTLHLLVLELLATLVPLDDAFHGGARNWFTAVQAFAIKGGEYEPPHRRRRPEMPFVERCIDLLAVPGSDVPVRLEDGDVVAPGGARFPLVHGVPRFAERSDAEGPRR